MKNKLLKAFIFYLSFMIVGVMINGCCEQNYEIVGSGEFAAYVGYNNPSNYIDTIGGEFNLIADFEMRVTGLLNNNVLINNTLATSCKDNFLNMLLSEKTQLSINKPFDFEGQIIDSGTNILNLKHIMVHTDTMWGYVEVNFTADFMQNAKFDKGDHEFKIKAETSDGLFLENKTTIYVDIE
jgi:hypothetical protein